jgi:Ca2+-binding RTX toxin-like protein
MRPAAQSADRRQNIEGSNFDDRLTGDAGINVIYGRSGNDVLDGGAGADVMFGADGNDTYYVDNLGDSVIEL